MVEGRNGSGKTSLLRTLCGMALPDAGDILWCGEDIFRLGADYHACTAYVGHRDGIKLDLTPLENLTFARSLGNPSPECTAQQALDAVKLGASRTCLRATFPPASSVAWRWPAC